MIDYKKMIKIELKYNILKCLEHIKYPIDDDKIILNLLNTYEYESLPENICDFVRFSKSWNHNYNFIAIYKNNNTDRFSYIFFNIILKQNQD